MLWVLLVAFTVCISSDRAAGSSTLDSSASLTADVSTVFTNPSMGFTKWVSTDKPKNEPAISSVYTRFSWDDVQPTSPSTFDWSPIDNWIARHRQEKMSVSWRIMPMGSGKNETWTPQWLRNLMPASAKDLKPTGEWIVYCGDDTFMYYAERLVRAMGARYNGHPALAYIDIGMVGLWGEWHMSGEKLPMPPFNKTTKFIDWHLKAFPDTNLVMLIGPGDELKYATANHTGIRADCFGDMGFWGSNWYHMRDMYPPRLAASPDAWKLRPIAFESCGTISEWVDKGFDLQYIFNKGLEWHASYLNDKSADIPDKAVPYVNSFLLKMGYRLALRKLHVVATPGQSISIDATWENLGVAPIYVPTTVTWRLVKWGPPSQVLWAANSTVTDLRTVMPLSSGYSQVHWTDTFNSFPQVSWNRTVLELGVTDRLGRSMRVAIKDVTMDGSYHTVLDIGHVISSGSHIFPSLLLLLWFLLF